MAYTIRQQEDSIPTAAFALSLLAGLWIVAMDGVINGLSTDQMQKLMSGQDTFGSWLSTEQMFGPSLWPLFTGSIGFLIIAGAALLYAKPAHRHIWGILIVAASGVDFLFGAGGILGGVLGVTGGIIAIAS